MAERESTIKSLAKGLNLDSPEHLQPEGTYRYALNASFETHKGEIGYLTNDLSNESCISLDDNETVVGSCYIGNNESVVFIHKDNLLIDDSSIYIFNHELCTKTLIVAPGLNYLNFNTLHPIQAEFRVRNGCERWVYFVDHFNTDKAVNLDAPANYYNNNPKLLEHTLYGDPYTLSLVDVKNSGGKIPVGTLQITARYLDRYNNRTEFFGLSLPIPITLADTSFASIIGGKSGLADKSVQYKFDNLDTAFSFLEIAVVETTEGISNAYIVDKLPIVGNSITYNYIGTDRATTKLSSLQEIVQQYSVYRIAKTITQKDNRLLKANLKMPEYDWLKFQRSAMDITGKYVVKEKRTQKLDYSANNPFYYFDDKSYMRDEVYAFGIRWVMKDGTKSPVFHIPGRQAIDNAGTVTTGDAATTAKKLVRDIVAPDTKWDKKLIDTSTLNISDYRHLSDYIKNCTGSCPTYTGGSHTMYILYTETDSVPNTFEISLAAPSANISFKYEETAPSNNVTGPTNFSTAVHTVSINNTTPNETDAVFGNVTITYTSGSCTWSKVLELTIDGLDRLVTCNNPDNYIQYYSSGTKRGIKVEISEFFFNSVTNNTTCQLDRWRLYNTAIPDTTPETGYYASGTMAYTESDSETYPVITDCDGNSVFGSNAGQPVRHHKFPDAQISPYFTGWHDTTYTYPQEMNDLPISIFPIGIKFSNIQPPAQYSGDVEYYEIVRCEVEETVLEKGILSAFRLENFGNGECKFTVNPNYEGLTTEYTTPNNYILDTEVIAPKPLFNKEVLKPDYIRLEKVFGFLRNDTSVQPGGTGPTAGMYNRMIIDGNISNSLLVAATFKGSVNPWACRSVQNELILKYNSYFTDDRYPYGTVVSSQNQIGYFTNLIDGVPFTVITKGAPPSSGPYSANSYIQYISLKKINFSQYYGLSSLTYIRCQNNLNAASSTSSSVFGGDTFLSRMEYLQTFNLNGALLNKPVSTTYQCGSPLTNNYYYSTRVSFITESRINTELRTLENNHYFYPYVNLVSDNFLNPFDSSLGYHLESSGSFDSWKELYYTYNKDYSFSGGISTFSPPDYSIACSSCQDYFPNRVIWTNTSEPDDTFDNYRIFRLADFLDVQGHKGEITRIFPEGDYLTIDCERTRFIVATTRQALQGTTENIYVGLGDYLTNQMREVSNASAGFLGNQSQFCFENTEYGVFTVDQVAGKVFKTFNNQPEILSNKGLRNWFTNNLPSEIQKQYLAVTGDKYPIADKVGHSNGGTGVISVYDSRFERLIISKRDFKFTPAGLAMLAASGPSDYIRVTENGIYLYVGGVDRAIRQENYPEWFENKSWTISYSVKHDAWMSWHSFLPNYYILGMNTFMSGVNDNTVNGTPKDPHRHNKQYSHQTYYGTLHPHIIEVVAATPVEPTILKNVRVLSYAEEFDVNYGQYVTKPQSFFNKVCIYNSRQITGELELYFIDSALSQNIKNVASKLPVVYRDNYYNFNQFADASDNKSALFSTSWTDLQSSYFTDKVVNLNGLVGNKPWFNRMAFRDRYHIIRLIHDKASNVKLSTNFVINYNENIYA